MMQRILKPLLLTALICLPMAPVVAQYGNGSKYNTSEDSIRCGMYLSTYKEFFRMELYDYAYEAWWNVFNDCPASSENLYVNGVTMYRIFIEAAPNGPVREGLIDTLMLIYDQRMEYFGGEGNVLGRKGKDLLNYRRGDIEQVQHAHTMLEKSIQLQGSKSQESVLLLFISADIAMVKKGKIDDIKVIEDYFMVLGLLDQMKKSSRRERTRTMIDELIIKENILSCEALKQYYKPRFETNKSDKAYLEKVITLYTSTGCTGSDIYAAASEYLYTIEPGPLSAHNLAILFITKNNFEKAVGYLEEALQSEQIDSETRAVWYYELAVVTSARDDYCNAIDYTRKAIALKDDYGKAYILLGDTFIAARHSLGDDLQQRTAYWAAADMYAKAGSADSSLAEEALQKLTDYAGQYPSREDVFFLDLKEADSYLVGGCINEYTTVRSRK